MRLTIYSSLALKLQAANEPLLLRNRLGQVLSLGAARTRPWLERMIAVFDPGDPYLPGLLESWQLPATVRPLIK
jgi:hypothetical protein